MADVAQSCPVALATDKQHCETITKTQWKTVTTTDVVTVVQPSYTTKTVLVPTLSVVPTTATVTAPGRVTTVSPPVETKTPSEKTVVLPGSTTVLTD